MKLKEVRQLFQNYLDGLNKLKNVVYIAEKQLMILFLIFILFLIYKKYVK